MVTFVVMTVCALVFFASLGVRVGPPASRTNLSMNVGDVNGLFVDSNVLLRGVPVGKVTRLSTGVNGAVVDFYIDNRYRVPVDTDVKLGNLSALGESYIQLAPRTAGGPTMQDGQRIATERIHQPAYVSDLAASMGRLLNQADPRALQRAIRELDEALPPPEATLPNLVHTSVLLRNVAADMNGQGAALIDNFQTLLQNASWVGPILARLAPYLPKVGYSYQGILSGALSMTVIHGAPNTLVALRRLLDRVQHLLDTNGADLRVIGERFLPQMQGIAGALMNFDPSQIMSNILSTLPEDGAVTLHVVPK